MTCTCLASIILVADLEPITLQLAILKVIASLAPAFLNTHDEGIQDVLAGFEACKWLLKSDRSLLDGDEVPGVLLHIADEGVGDCTIIDLRRKK